MSSLKSFKLSTNYGFGLSEFLFVIGILAVSAFFLLKVFDPYDKYISTQDDKRKQDLKSIQQILERYKKSYGKYPRSVNNRILGMEWGNYWEPLSINLPKDPLFPSQTYIYVVNDTNQTYWIYASLKRGKKDKSVCKADLEQTGNRCVNVPLDTNGNYVVCGKAGEECNYGVSSDNTAP